MPSIKLSNIQDEADKRYGPFVIEDIEGGDVVLRHAIRLDDAGRQKWSDLWAEAGNAAPDRERQVFTEIVQVLAETPDMADRLLKAVEGDYGKLATIVRLYMEAAQPGEAQPSQS